MAKKPKDDDGDLALNLIVQGADAMRNGNADGGADALRIAQELLDAKEKRDKR
jgi:hypothetical protein